VELFLSLSLQAALLVALAHWLARLAHRDALRSRIWDSCHVLLLGLAVAAVMLPHARPLNPWQSLSTALAIDLAQLERRIGATLLCVWSIGAAGSLGLLAFSWWRVHRFLRGCEEVGDESVRAQFDAVRRETGTHGQGEAIRFLCSPLLRTPFCWQVNRALIVLPDELLGLPPEELKFIMRHELEHLRAGHPLMLFVQRIVEILFWFHPMIWWSSQQATLAREFSCDAAAVGSAADLSVYLKTLVKIIEGQTDEADASRIDLAFGRGRSLVARRARRLLELSHEGHVSAGRRTESVLSTALVAGAVVIAFAWVPSDVLSSPRTSWSPWPRWTARALHAAGVNVRDFDVYDRRHRLREMSELLEKERDARDAGVAPRPVLTER
jgi:beta-lactamase regulating signal transducer with metallopeptidase domain